MKKEKRKLEDNDFAKYLSKIENSKKTDIQTDSKFFFIIIKELIFFIFKLPFFIIMSLISLISLNFKKFNFYFSKIYLEPFLILSKGIDWFFQAKYTAFLILFLIFIFLIEIFFLIPHNLTRYFMFAPNTFLQGNYFSIISSIFLHASIIHLVGNLLGILIFGRIVEKEFKFNVLSIFLSSAIIANIVSGIIYYFQLDFTPALGASGGVAGLIIFAILLNPFAFTSFFLVSIPIFVLGWLLIFLDFIGITNRTETNHLAHIGGYLSILILFFFLEFKNKRKIMVGLLFNLFLLFLAFMLSNYINLEIIKRFFWFLS